MLKPVNLRGLFSIRTIYLKILFELFESVNCHIHSSFPFDKGLFSLYIIKLHMKAIEFVLFSENVYAY